MWIVCVTVWLKPRNSFDVVNFGDNLHLHHGGSVHSENLTWDDDALGDWKWKERKLNGEEERDREKNPNESKEASNFHYWDLFANMNTKNPISSFISSAQTTTKSFEIATLKWWISYFRCDCELTDFGLCLCFCFGSVCFHGTLMFQPQSISFSSICHSYTHIRQLLTIRASIFGSYSPAQNA